MKIKPIPEKEFFDLVKKLMSSMPNKN